MLDWRDQQYTLDVQASLLDGVFKLDEKFQFNGGTRDQPAEVIVSAEADVDVPHGIPFVGGKKLGSLDFLFKYVSPYKPEIEYISESMDGSTILHLAGATDALGETILVSGCQYSAYNRVHTIEERTSNSVTTDQPFRDGQDCQNSDTNTSNGRATYPADGQARGFVAAWTRINLIFTHVEAGIEYNLKSNKVKTIGHNAIKNLKKSVSTNSSQTTFGHKFSNQCTQDDQECVPGATRATLSVDWSRTFVTQPDAEKVDFQVVLPNGTVAVLGESGINEVNDDALSGTTDSNDSSSTLETDTEKHISVINPAAATVNCESNATDGSPLVTVTSCDKSYSLDGWGLVVPDGSTLFPEGTTVISSDGDRLTLSQPALVTDTDSADPSLTFRSPFDPLPNGSDGDYTEHELRVTFKGNPKRVDSHVGIDRIVESNGMTQVTFSEPIAESLPPILAGDTITVTGSSVGAYNTTRQYRVVEVVTDGVIINQPYQDQEATGGTLKDWTEPQFNATYHIPAPNAYIQQLPDNNTSSRLPVTVPIQVDAALAEKTTVNLYIDSFDSRDGANQAFDGVLLARSVPIGPDPNTPTGLSAEVQADLDQSNLGLLPAADYYLYAVVNDGTNTPVTTSLTPTESGGYVEVFTNNFDVWGSLANQHGDALAGWTVFVDLDNDRLLDSNEPSYVTTSQGTFGFYADQVSTGELDLVVSMHDPGAFAFLPDEQPANQGYGVTLETEDGSVLTRTLDWSGGTSVSSFFAHELTAISGKVESPTTDANGNIVDEGLGGWTAYFDTNQNGRLDPGETATRTAADGEYRFTNLNAAAILQIAEFTSIEESTGAEVSNTVLELAAAVPAKLSVGDMIRVSKSSVADYNTTHLITAIGGTSITTDVAFTDKATGGLVAGPGFEETVALAIMNGSAATYTFDADQVDSDSQPPTIFDSSGSPNSQQHVGTLASGAEVGTATAFHISDHANASGSGNEVLRLPISNSNVGQPFVSDLQPGHGAFSVAGWLRPDAISGLTPAAGLLESGSASGGWEFGVTENTFAFAEPQSRGGLALQPDFVTMADLNGDGRQDLVTANSGSNFVTVALNATVPGATDTRFMGQELVLQVGLNPTFIVAEDFNADGRLDLAVANSGSDSVSFLMNQTMPGDSAPVFATAPNVDVNGSPGQLTAADFNADGRTDVAVVTSGSSAEVVVLYNTTMQGSTTADLSFAAAVGLAAMTPSFIAVEDFNADAKPDLMVAVDGGSGSTVVFYRNISSAKKAPKFDDPIELDFEDPVSFLIAADFDGDGGPDLAAVNPDGRQVLVAHNVHDDNLILGQPVAYDVGTGPSHLVVGEFNGDGRPDLAVTNSGSNDVSVSLNTGGSGFQTLQETIGVGVHPDFLLTDDFNLDGKADLVVANSGGSDVSVLLNTTDLLSTTESLETSSFQVNTFAAGDGPLMLTTSDFNGDGKPDLAVANKDANDVSLLLNESIIVGRTLDFAGQQTFGVGDVPNYIAEADFDGDGRLDLAVANSGGNHISVLINNSEPGGATRFKEKIQCEVGSNPTHIVVADINLDGRPDLAVANAGAGANSIHVFLNEGPNSDTACDSQGGIGFTRKLITVGNNPNFIAVSDFNLDGKPDLAVTSSKGDTVRVLLNTITDPSQASFQDTEVYVGNNNDKSLLSFIAVGDFNGDTKPDFAVARQGDARVAVVINQTTTGNSSFSPHFSNKSPAPTISVRAEPEFIVVEDFNLDGKVDLAVANSGDNTVSLILNETIPGATKFAPASAQRTLTVGQNPSHIAVADLNGDGKPDLAVANKGSSSVDPHNISVLFNSTDPGAPSPNFGEQLLLNAGNNPSFIAVDDFNGDGIPDLVTSNSGGDHLSTWVNKTPPGAADGVFSDRIQLAVGDNPEFIAVGDYNNDGKPDLAVANANRSDPMSASTVSVLQNNHLVDATGPYVRLVENSSLGDGSMTFVGPLTIVDTNTWSHVAFSYDPAADANGDGQGAGAVAMYVNGVMTATSGNRGSLPGGADVSSPSGVPFHLGGSFTGYLDEISVWNASLTPTQIQALFNGTTSPSYALDPSSPASYSVTIDDSGADLQEGKDFQVVESATITGSLQGIAADNGELEAEAQPLVGWTVRLRDDNDQIVASATSQFDGRYLLPGVPPGTYSLDVLVRPGWRRTFATNGGSPLVLRSGDVLTGQDFLHAAIGDSEVYGQVFDDPAGTGQLGPGQPGRAGATVFLDVDRSNSFTADDISTITVGHGVFTVSVGDVPDGAYRLGIVALPGRRQSGPQGGFHEIVVQDGVPQDASEPRGFWTIARPHPEVIGVNVSPVAAGDPFVVTAVINHFDSPLLPPEARIDWGDGNTTTVAVTQGNGATTFSADHVYDAPGSYDAAIFVTRGHSADILDSVPFTAVVTGAQPIEGVLELLGTSGDDEFLVGNDSVTFNGQVISLAEIETLRLVPGAGNDEIVLNVSGTSSELVEVVIEDSSGDDVYSIASEWLTIDINDADGFETLDFSEMESRIVLLLSLDDGRSRRLGSSNVRLGLTGSLETIIGTPYNDVIYGSPNDDFVWGGAGNDSIRGLGGDDYLDGQEGRDRLRGDDGLDHLVGGGGRDYLSGGDRADILDAGDDRDLLRGDAGRDILLGGHGRDLMFGGADDDLLVGGIHLNLTDSWSALRNEWMADRPFEERVANMKGDSTGPSFAARLNGNQFLTASPPEATIQDDAERDLLFGQSGRDWFWAQLNSGVVDRVLGPSQDDTLDPI